MSTRTMLIALVSTLVVISAATTSAPAAASPARACAEFGGTIEADQTCRVYDKTPNYTLDFQFPVDYPDQQALKDYVTQRRDGFIEWVAELSPSPYFALHIIGSSYHSGAAASATQSLVLTIGTDGGVRPVTTYKAFNYDMTKQVPITFDTLFKPGTQPLAVLNPIVQRTWENRGGRGALSFEGVDSRTYENFALTDEGVLFFLNQDGLLPHEAGDLKVTVPRSEIESLLA